MLKTTISALAAAVIGTAMTAAMPALAADAIQKFPDIIAAKIAPRGASTFDFDVTVSSPYDTPARYADAFRVKDASGKVLGERTLFHDHQTEQPFTRDLYGVKIPDTLTSVTIEGRDQKYGWGGKTLTVVIPRQ